MNTFQLYFRLGVDHILNWSSLDHILFLLVLIIVFEWKDYRKLILLVNLFTIAHTFSLYLSVYGVLKINEDLIENLILWTIFITAVSNILISKERLLHSLHFYFSFFFGLIHGLGFANDFKMLIAGQSEKLLPLLSFALGIEIAQIILGLVILAVMFLLQKTISNQKEVYRIISALAAGYVLALLFS
jgi:hypothetical protein